MKKITLVLIAWLITASNIHASGHDCMPLECVQRAHSKIMEKYMAGEINRPPYYPPVAPPCPPLLVRQECDALKKEVKRYVLQPCLDTIYDLKPEDFGGLTKIQARKLIDELLGKQIKEVQYAIIPLMENQGPETRRAIYKAHKDLCVNQYSDNYWRFNKR